MDQHLEEAVEEVDVEDLEGSTDIEEEGAGKGSKDSDVRNSLNEDGTLPANALDLRSPAQASEMKLKLKLYVFQEKPSAAI